MGFLKQLLGHKEKKCTYCETLWQVNVDMARKAADQNKQIRQLEDEIARLKANLEEAESKIGALTAPPMGVVEALEAIAREEGLIE